MALWALAAGALIPVMATLNGGLARATGQPLLAAGVLFAVGFTAIAIVMIAFARPDLSSLRSAPPASFAGGLIVAFYVVSVTMLAPRIGVGATIVFVLAAQLCTSAAIDHFGLFGALIRPVNPMRLAGLFVILGGIAMTQIGPQR